MLGVTKTLFPELPYEFCDSLALFQVRIYIGVAFIRMLIFVADTKIDSFYFGVLHFAYT